MERQMSEMTEARLAQMQALVEKVPADIERTDGTAWIVEGNQIAEESYEWHQVKWAEGDADFIEFAVAARSFVPDALAHIERLERDLANVRAIGALNFDTYVSDIEKRDARIAARDAELKEVWTHLEMENSNRDRLIEAIAPGEIPPPVEELVAQVEGMRAEVARLTEERDTLSHLYTLSEIAKNLAYAERGKADTALATLRGKVKARIAKWRQDMESYPGTVIGLYASSAVKLCADELQADMDALGLPDTEAK